jgi:anti-anti-sigma regulatory factor
VRYTVHRRLEQCGPTIELDSIHAVPHPNNRLSPGAGFGRPDMTVRLILEDQLDFNARIEFSMRASEVVRHADGRLGVDCSGIQLVDEPLIGLLTWLTRNARQRGLQVVLERPSPTLLAALERAGVLDRFLTDEA